MSTIQERIYTLRRNGMSRDVVAAVLGVTAAEVASVGADPETEVTQSGGADLSAVDEDITLLNGSKVILADEPENEANVGVYYEPGNGALTIEGNEENYGATPVYIIAPGGSPDGPGSSIVLVADSASPEIRFGIDTDHASIAMEDSSTLGTQDMLHVSGRGPIVRSPSGEKWRLTVADNGTVGTTSLGGA